MSNHELDFKEFDQFIKNIGKIVYEKSMDFLNREVSYEYLKSYFKYVSEYWLDDYRPALMYLSCESVGGIPEKTYPFAVMMNLLCCGIGMHDDVIDKTREKHFKTTISGKFGEDTGLTLGDIFIVKGLTYFREIYIKEYEYNTFYKILESFEQFVTEMCVGEIMEIKNRKNIGVDLNLYDQSLWKLGIDSEACCKIGSIIGNGSKLQIDSLSRYGKCLGYLNRLVDEIEVTINRENVLLNRIKNESITYPILYSAKKSIKNYDIINNILNKENLDNSDIISLIEICFDSGAFEYIIDISEKTTNEAIKCLKNIKQDVPKKYLENMIMAPNLKIKKIV